jgi:hypothetical protein
MRPSTAPRNFSAQASGRGPQGPAPESFPEAGGPRSEAVSGAGGHLRPGRCTKGRAPLIVGLTRRRPLSMPTGMGREWLRIAHRGASGSLPEHTRPAFERALDLGVDMIELDVQLSRDGVLVVLHDLDLQRTTGVAGAVRTRSFAEIKTLDAGGWYGAQFSGQPVLSLDEVIDIVGTRARLNVEVKAPVIDWPVLATTLTGTLRRRGLLDASVISCFGPAALARRLRKRGHGPAGSRRCPSIRIGCSSPAIWSTRRMHAASACSPGP